jgi:hypothetical protein
MSKREAHVELCGGRCACDDPGSMFVLVLRCAVLVVLGCQGGMAARDAWRLWQQSVQVPWSLRCAASDARLRTALGGDADLLFAVRAAVPPGTLLLNQKVMGDITKIEPARLLQLAAKNGLIDQLTVLLYPDPWVISVPDPIATIEGLAARGRAAVLLVLPGDAEPAGRAGWSIDVAQERFSTWRFQKV